MRIVKVEQCLSDNAEYLAVRFCIFDPLISLAESFPKVDTMKILVVICFSMSRRIIFNISRPASRS
jgi:hypothetical protein